MEHTRFLEALMRAWVMGWYSGRKNISDDRKHADCPEIAGAFPDLVAVPDLLEACGKWAVLSEKIKDRLTGDDCAELGLYDFDNILQQAIAKAKA